MFVYIVVRGESTSLVKAFSSREEAVDWCGFNWHRLVDAADLADDMDFAIVRMIVGEMSMSDYLEHAG